MVRRAISEKHPHPGQVYRHRKHAPDSGHWHEYKVLDIVEPRRGLLDQTEKTHFYYPQAYRHTGTKELHVLTGCGVRIYADDISEPLVAYKNTRPNLCDPEWAYCLRPLREFVDGHFTQVNQDKK